VPRRLPVEIPQSPDAITDAWLTGVLRPSCGLTGSTVVGHSCHAPEAGVGFSSNAIRVDLTWDAAAGEDPPRRVLVKVPTTNRSNRGLVESEGGYDREYQFYERFADDFPVRIPRRLYAAQDPGRSWRSMARQFRFANTVPGFAARFIGRYSRTFARPTRRRVVMVLEYVDNARLTPLDATPTESDLVEVLAAQARIHAAHWRSPLLRDDEPFGWRTGTQVPNILQGTYAVFRDRVVAERSHLLTPDVMALADWIDANLVAAVDHLDEPLALLHGDARSDNMLFDDNGLVMIDFGLISSGRPGWDVGYLLSGTLADGPEVAAQRDRLIAGYHTRLVAAGVTDHSLAQLRNDVDVTVLWMLHRMILTAAVFEGSGYGEVDLSDLWLAKIRALLPGSPPVLGDVSA